MQPTCLAPPSRQWMVRKFGDLKWGAAPGEWFGPEETAKTGREREGEREGGCQAPCCSVV